MSLRLAGGRSVSEVLAVVPDAERQLRQMVLEGHHRSEPRRRVDGTVEVDAWLPTPLLTRIIQEIAAHYLPKVELPLLEVEAPARPALMATVRVSSDARPAAAPPGWRYCSPRRLALTRSAAEVDLRQHLLTRLTQWRLSAYQTLGRLWARRPDFRRAVRQQIETLPLSKPIFEPTGICRLPAEFHRDDVVRLLIRAAASCEPAIEADLSQAIDPDFHDPLVLDGFSVAPPLAPTSPSSLRLGGIRRPQWADRFLTAKRIGRPPSGVADPKTRRARAAAAARIDSKRQLWIRIEQLALPTGGTIGELLAVCPQASTAIAAIDAAILSVGEPTFDDTGGASVSLGVQLGTVWEIVRELPAQNPPAHR